VQGKGHPRVRRQARHVAKRRAEGKCAREGCKETASAYYCPAHKREHRERMRKSRSGILKRGPRFVGVAG